MQDTPRLTLVVVDPVRMDRRRRAPPADSGMDQAAGRVAQTLSGSLVWCVRKARPQLQGERSNCGWRGSEWRRRWAGTLGGDFDHSDRAEAQSKIAEAEEAAKDEVWGDYRFVVIKDSQEPDGRTIDLGAGHSSGGETLCGRVITPISHRALLSESVGRS